LSDTQRQRKTKLIVDAAARVFLRQGYHASSTGDIARESGIPEGSLYYHIQSREELLFIVLMEAAKRVESRLRSATSFSGSASKRLQAAIKEAVVFTCTDDYAPLALTFVDHGGALNQEHRDQYVGARDACENVIRDLVSGGVAAGEFAAVDASLASRLWLGAVSSIRLWYRHDGSLSPDDIATFYADSMSRALTAGVGHPGPGKVPPTRRAEVAVDCGGQNTGQ
jgi:AcrR family transcriptional regulator